MASSGKSQQFTIGQNDVAVRESTVLTRRGPGSISGRFTERAHATSETR